MNAIDVIKQRIAEMGPSQVLDRVVPDPNAISNALNVVGISGNYDSITVCRDVPVWSVVSLGRSDFLQPGDTWADAGSTRLTDFWPMDCLDYLESPLYLAFLNQGSARLYLELYSVGGAVVCSNANHRLAAAIAWLVAKDKNDDANLNMVQLNVRKADEASIEHLLKLWRAGRQISWARDGHGDYYIKVTERFAASRIYERIGSGFAHKMWLHPVMDWWTQPRRFFTDPEVWAPFPDCILEAWGRRSEWDGWKGEGEAIPVGALADRVIAQKQADALTWCRARAAEHVANWRQKEGALWNQVADAIEDKLS